MRLPLNALSVGIFIRLYQRIFYQVSRFVFPNSTDLLARRKITTDALLYAEYSIFAVVIERARETIGYKARELEHIHAERVENEGSYGNSRCIILVRIYASRVLYRA